MTMLASYNPANGNVVGEVPVTPADQIQEAVNRARAAQPDWAALGPQGRAETLKRAADLFQARVDSHAELMTREQGKPLKLSLIHI